MFYLFIQDLDFWRPVTKEETKNNFHSFIVTMKNEQNQYLMLNFTITELKIKFIEVIYIWSLNIYIWHKYKNINTLIKWFYHQ